MLNVIMFQKCLMQFDKNFWNYKMDQHFPKEKWCKRGISSSLEVHSYVDYKIISNSIYPCQVPSL